MSSAATPVTASARSSVHSSADAMYSAKPDVARSTNAVLTSPAWMISRPTASASGMSVPTRRPSQRSAQAAVAVRRGSTTKIRAPRSRATSTWWKKIGCVSRAFEPHMTMTSEVSAS